MFDFGWQSRTGTKTGRRVDRSRLAGGPADL